jgi:hypothetical protein
MWHINNLILTPKLVRIVRILDKPLSTQIGWCILTQLCECHLEFHKAKEPFLLYIDYFSLTRILYYFAKRIQASSILSEAIAIGLATSHTPIITTDLLQMVSYWDEKILTCFVLTWSPFKSPFFLIPLYIFGIHIVFINKALQSFDDCQYFFFVFWIPSLKGKFHLSKVTYQHVRITTSDGGKLLTSLSIFSLFFPHFLLYFIQGKVLDIGPSVFEVPS